MSAQDSEAPSHAAEGAEERLEQVRSTAGGGQGE